MLAWCSILQQPRSRHGFPSVGKPKVSQRGARDEGVLWLWVAGKREMAPAGVRESKQPRMDGSETCFVLCLCNIFHKTVDQNPYV